jgi:protein-tyrosine phosphatase
MADSHRIVLLDSVQNIRDLGGLRTRDGRTTRTGRLFRADGVHRLAPQDVTRMRTLDLSTVIDLRSESEVLAEGSFPVQQIPVEWIHIPTVDEGRHATVPPVDRDHPNYLFHAYFSMFERSPQTLARSVTAIADASHAGTLFHCAAGKDRTGVLAMLVLGILDVERELIIEDYAMSNNAVKKIKAWNQMHNPDIAARQATWPDRVMSANPENMRLLVEAVENQHGSITQLVLSLGVSVESVQKLRTNLIA